MADNPICIRRTHTSEEADIIVAWLAEHGIEAHVSDPENPGVMAFGATDTEGIAVCVADEDVAVQAKAKLAEHDREVERAHRSDAPIQINCDECGAPATFPPDAAGTVQQCDACRAYIDVPGGES